MASELQRTFGDRVRQRREQLGISQKQLADRLRIHQPDLCDIEKGRHSPTLETVEKIAKALGEPPSYFVADHTTHRS